MIFHFRMRQDRHVAEMRQAFESTPHFVFVEPAGSFFGDGSRTDAEFLSMGLAERFGAVPRKRIETAYVVSIEEGHRDTASHRIITGVTLGRLQTPLDEFRSVIRAIVNCVNRFNRDNETRIETVGISEDHIPLDKAQADQISQIISEELGANGLR